MSCNDGVVSQSCWTSVGPVPASGVSGDKQLVILLLLQLVWLHVSHLCVCVIVCVCVCVCVCDCVCVCVCVCVCDCVCECACCDDIIWEWHHLGTVTSWP